jgi:hypothetical protein
MFENSSGGSDDNRSLNTIVAQFEYNSDPGDTTFQIQGQVFNGAGTCEIRATDTFADGEHLEISVYRFPN